jgi:hypothetical protein
MLAPCSSDEQQLDSDLLETTGKTHEHRLNVSPRYLSLLAVTCVAIEFAGLSHPGGDFVSVDSKPHQLSEVLAYYAKASG